MRTFTAPCIRLMAAAMFALLLMIATSSGADAQVCACENITVNVDPGVLCTIELHPAAPLCRYRPIFAAPGTSVPIACCDDMQLTIVTCDGTDVTFVQGGPTSFSGVNIAPGCCVDASISRDAKGCIVVDIRPSAARCLGCNWQ